MFPLSDSTPRQRTPVINYLIILANIYVFYLQLSAPDLEVFVNDYAFIPAHFDFLNPFSWISIFTGMFMHGGFMHILSNMWFLHIFGDNAEDAVGHIPYLLFYLAGGVVATLSQYILAPASLIPMIGASGAVSAAAGLYFVLYRHSKVRTLVPLFLGLFDIINIPVWLFLGYWFFLQLFSSIGSIGLIDAQGGVAYMAHVGGFIFGYFVGQFVKREVKAPSAWYN